MPKKLFANGVSGDVAIYEGGHEAAFTSPLANLDKVYFHSSLDYVGVAHIYNGVISHPARAASAESDKYLVNNKRPLNGTQEWPLLSFPNAGYVPHGILVVNGEQMPGAAPVQRNGAASSRYIMLRMTQTSAILREHWHTFNDSLAALNVTYSLYVFTGPIAQSGDKTLLITPTQMIASRGKLNTSYRYIRSVAANPDFRLIRGPVADVRGGGLRIVTPAGTVIDDGVYNGSFAGTPSKGCSI